MSSDQRLVTVLTSSDIGMIAVAETELQNAKIPYRVTGKQVSAVLPELEWPRAMAIQVMEADADAACALLAVLDVDAAGQNP